MIVRGIAARSAWHADRTGGARRGAECDDAVLEQELVAHTGIRSSRPRHPEPTQLGAPHARDRRPGVNPMVLWAEYRGIHRQQIIPRLHAQKQPTNIFAERRLDDRVSVWLGDDQTTHDNCSPLLKLRCGSALCDRRSTQSSTITPL